MRSVLREREKLAALANVHERDIQPVVAGNENVNVYLSGGDPPTSPVLLTFKVPDDRCAVLTLFKFSSRPGSSFGGTGYPDTFADLLGRVDGIGYEGLGTITVTTGSGNLIRAVPVVRINGAALFVVVQPGATVTVTYDGSLAPAAETQQAWSADTRVTGYLLPEGAAELLNKSNTLFL